MFNRETTEIIPSLAKYNGKVIENKLSRYKLKHVLAEHTKEQFLHEFNKEYKDGMVSRLDVDDSLVKCYTLVDTTKPKSRACPYNYLVKGNNVYVLLKNSLQLHSLTDIDPLFAKDCLVEILDGVTNFEVVVWLFNCLGLNLIDCNRESGLFYFVSLRVRKTSNFAGYVTSAIVEYNNNQFKLKYLVSEQPKGVNCLDSSKSVNYIRVGFDYLSGHPVLISGVNGLINNLKVTENDIVYKITTSNRIPVYWVVENNIILIKRGSGTDEQNNKGRVLFEIPIDSLPSINELLGN